MVDQLVYVTAYLRDYRSGTLKARWKVNPKEYCLVYRLENDWANYSE